LASLLGATVPSGPPVDVRKLALRRLRTALQGDDDDELSEALKGAMEAVNDNPD
jgi:hypothetical protein